MSYEMDDLQAGRRRGSRMPQRPGAAGRLINAARETGTKNMGKQQGTTWTIYDTVDLFNSGTTLQFFQALNGKNYPWTNLQQNKFSQDEGMVIERAYLTILNVTGGTQSFIYTPGSINLPQTIEESAFPEFYLAEGTIIISGSQVLKKFSFLSSFAPFNYSAKFSGLSSNGEQGEVIGRGHSVYNFSSTPAIPPNVEFSVPISVPQFQLPANAGLSYCRLTLEGFGSIPNVGGTL